MHVGVLRSQFDSAWGLFVDNRSMCAQHGGHFTGPNPTDKAKNETKCLIAVNEHRLPVACVVTGANVDCTVVFERLVRVAVAVLV